MPAAEGEPYATAYVPSPDSAPAMPMIAHVGVFCSVLMPTLVVVACFSVEGWGDATYVTFVAYGYGWPVPFVVSGATLLLLWVLDARHWHTTTMLCFRNAGLLTACLGVGVGCSLATRVYPLAPLLFAMLFIPASILCVRFLALPAVPAWRYFLSLSHALFAVAALNFGYFLLWTLALLPPPSRLRTGWDPQWSNVWGGEVKEYWRGRLGCEPFNATALELGRAEDRDCYDAAFLWWSLPLIVVLAESLFALVIRLLGRVLEPSAANPEAQTVKIFSIAVSFAFVGIYVAASIAGAGTGLSEVVLTGFVGLLVVACAVVVGSLGWSRFAAMVMETPAAKSMASDASASEWLIALLLVVGALPLLCWLALKLLHQALRARLHRTTSFQQGPEGGHWFTRGTHERWEAMRHRHWGSICMKIAILGVGYLALQVLVMKVVVVFLSQLNQWLEPFSPLVVALVFALVGTSMFLCPIIPGERPPHRPSAATLTVLTILRPHSLYSG